MKQPLVGTLLEVGVVSRDDEMESCGKTRYDFVFGILQ